MSDDIMPCLIKQRTANSPGVITFTHNEAVQGLPAKYRRIRNFLVDSSSRGDWIYGVHIQGDCTYLGYWPLEPWQSFLMWSDTSAGFLSNVPQERLLPLTCINFMPDVSRMLTNHGERTYDLCVISRPSPIKRIMETLKLIRELLNKKPELKVVLIVPDPRHLDLGVNAYKKQGIEEGFFTLPRTMFSSRELRNISFLCSSQDAFGNFPLSSELITDILSCSKFVCLNSHLEGVPRVLAEAFLVGTPCIVSKNLITGIRRHLNSTNTVFIDDDISLGTLQVMDALENYERYSVAIDETLAIFGEVTNKPIFVEWLSKLIHNRGKNVDGRWYLDDLHLRLACHGEKYNSQFMNNDELFFRWLKNVESLGDQEPDDDTLLGTGLWRDEAKLSARSLIASIKTRFVRPSLRRIARMIPRS